MRIALTAPLIESDDRAAVDEALRSGRVAQGELAQRLGREFARCIGVADGVAVSSGTAALELALRALEIGANDEVIAPSYTCIAILHAIAAVGASPVLVDCRYDVEMMSYNLAAEQVAAARTSRTRAVIVPHMFGVAAAVDEIGAVGVPVIEDITLSLGATWRGRPVGSFGRVAVCSFHATKMITSGEGGAVASDDAALLTRARWLNGWEEEQIASRVADEVPAFEPRLSYRMSDVCAALARSQLAKLDSFVSRRRALARRYIEQLEGVAGVTLPSDAHPNVFYRFMVQIEAAPPDAVRAFAEHGVELGRGVYPPLHRYVPTSGHFPNTERAVASLISIPLYPALTDEQVTELLDLCRRLLPRLRA